MTDRQRRLLLVLPAVLLAAIVVPMALAWADLPDSMATHWGMNGEPNGHMPPLALLVGLAGLFVAMWVGVWQASRRMPFEARSFITGLGGIGGLLAAVGWTSVEANRGATDWTAAGEIGAVELILVFAVAIVGAVAGWVLAGPSGPHRTDVSAATRPTMPVDAGTELVWSGRGRGTVLIAIGVLMLGAAVVVWSAISLGLVLVALIVLLFAEVRATASRRGVVVALGWLGIPSRLLPLDTITGADVEDVSPMAYGGWGYRVRPGARGLIVRGGESLRLHRVDRPDLVLTVDDAARGAAVVNTLVARG